MPPTSSTRADAPRRVRAGRTGRSGQETEGEFWFDARAADRAERFFGLLRHVEGEWAGRPFVLDPWQRDFIRRLFGWKREDGTRRYRKAYLEIPRKNTKSTLGAGIALKLLLADDEPGAQIYGAAENRDQAGIIFRIAAAMVLGSPELRAAARKKGLDVLPSTKTILVRSTNSFYRAIPADAPSAHGINAHGVLFDELHTQPNRDLYDVLTTSQGARRQPLTVMMTTAGFDERSLCGQEHDYALKVLSGVIDDPSYLAVIFAAGKDDDWTAPETWKKANPAWDMLGPGFQRFLAEQCDRARQVPAFENTFKRLHLNIWTKQNVRWMSMEAWDRCNGILPADLGGRSCFGGLDLASVSDLTALALIFPATGDEKSAKVLMRFWVPEEGIERRSRLDGVPYDQWAREGWIKATSGNAADYSAIRADILDLAKKYRIEEIAYDRWGAYQLSQELDAEGVTMRPIGQGFRDMSAPTKELMRLVLAKEIEHGGNPVLRWNVDNLVVRTDPAGNLKPDKERSKEKIDGAVAVVMSVDGLMRREMVEPRIWFA